MRAFSQRAPTPLDDAAGTRQNEGMPTTKDPATERANQLRKAERDYERAAKRVEELRLTRNALMFDAIDAGWTHAQISRALGLSRGRVGQIMMNKADPEEATPDA